MVHITTGATDILIITALFTTATELLHSVVSFFTTTMASTILRHILSATPQMTVANPVAKSAYHFFLFILHGAITSVMPFFTTHHAGDVPC